MENNHKKEDSPVYRPAYPKEISKERYTRLKRQGITACPRCGSEAVRTGNNGKNSVCLRCGYLFGDSLIKENKFND